MGKRKYEQKHEERITAIRERTTAMKEKERVRDCVLQAFLSDIDILGYNGYVPAVG